jgi:hypothetical protein
VVEAHEVDGPAAAWELGVCGFQKIWRVQILLVQRMTTWNAA